MISVCGQNIVSEFNIIRYRLKEIHRFEFQFIFNPFQFVLQKELFLGKADPGSPRSERKMSSSSTSMKTKWLKAFRSLKPATAIAGTVK